MYTPEQLTSITPTPTEASQGFLKGWRNSVILNLNLVNATLIGYLAGRNLGQGHKESALLLGIAAGCLTAATILYGFRMSNESKSK